MIRRTLGSMSSRQQFGAAALVALILIGALAETGIFLMIVPLAQVVSSGENTLRQQVGPFLINASTTRLVFLAVVLLVVMTVSRFAANVVQARLSTGVELRERSRLFDAYIGAAWEVQAAEPPGRIQSIAGFASAKGELVSMVTNATRYFLNIAVMLSAAFLLAPVGALGITLLGGILFVAFRPLVATSRRLSAKYVSSVTKHNEDLGEVVAVGADMRVFSAGPGFRRRLSDSNRSALTAKRQSMTVSGLVAPTYQAIGLTLVITILGVASSRDVDLPVLGAVVILLIRSISYGQALQSVAQKLAEYRPAIDELERWHETYDNARVRHGNEPINQIEDVVLSDLSYVYADGTEALRSINLSMSKGDRIGLVGPSGSGKSTMAQILLGLRLPTEGDVAVNGVSTRQLNENQFRACATLVPQRSNAFRGSIRENIAFFRADVSPDDIEQAARSAGLHDTIMQLPDGYETVIGPSNRELSGGQLQRIGIARALAGRPSLIVLDEPTSALDVDSEELVTNTLQILSKDVIVVIVAHRVSTLRDCDRIAVLEAGEILVVGSPAEVAKQSAFYRRALASGTFSEELA
ncbi:MAG: ATP-binding cassette subfamily B protein [Ilumatobacter sp.]|jgi:ATP-binding cassette subfamily B protein